MFTPVSCVFEEAGGQFDNEDDPEERRPNCRFVLTSQGLSGALKCSRTAGDAFVCSSQTFPRVDIVCATCYEKPRSARRRLMGLSVCIFISACPDIISIVTATLRQADQVKSLSLVHLKLKRSPSSSSSASITCHQQPPPPLRAGCHIDVTVAVTIPMKPRQDGYGETEHKKLPPPSHLISHTHTHSLKHPHTFSKCNKILTYTNNIYISTTLI